MTIKEIEKVRNDKKAEIGYRIKSAVEEICREVQEVEEVLPIVSVTTSPESVYGGFSRKVTAHVTVDFIIPGCRPFHSK